MCKFNRVKAWSKKWYFLALLVHLAEIAPVAAADTLLSDRFTLQRITDIFIRSLTETLIIGEPCGPFR